MAEHDLPWLTLKQGAARAQVSVSKLQRAIRARRCKCIYIDGRRAVRIRPAWIDEWLMSGSLEAIERQMVSR